MAASTASRPAGAEPPGAGARAAKVFETLPAAARLRDRAGLREASEAELRAMAQRLLDRRMLSAHGVALDTVADLEDVLALAAALAELRSRGLDDAELRVAEAQTAHLMHQAGHRVAADPGLLHAVREEIDALPKGELRDSAQALADSLESLEGVGRRWFPGAVHGALEQRPKDAMLHGLRGEWLLLEARPRDAVAAFRDALAVRATVPTAARLYEAWARRAEASETAAGARDALDAMDAVAGSITSAAPGLEPALDTRVAEIADARASRAWARGPGADVGRAGWRPDDAAWDEALAEVARRRRIGTPTSQAQALTLAKALAAARPGDPDAVAALAEALHAAGRTAALVELLADTAAGGAHAAASSPRLSEVAAAAAVEARLAAAAEGVSALPAAMQALAGRDWQRDVRQATAGDGPGHRWRQAALLHGVEVVLAVAEHGAARSDTARTKAAGEAAAALHALARAGGRGRPEYARLSAAAQLALGRPGDALGALRDGVRAPREGVAPDAIWRLRGLLGRLEVGWGVHRRDEALLDRGRRTLAALLDGADAPGHARAGLGARAAAEQARAVGAVARRVLGGRGAALDAETRAAARETLAGLVDRFDPTQPAGRRRAMAAAWSAGALAAAGGDEAGAFAALQRARAFAPELRQAPLGKLLAAQAAALAGDTRGAGMASEEALAMGPRRSVRFTALLWRAWAASEAGDPFVAGKAMSEALEIWDLARAPERVTAGAVRPLFVGDADLGVRLEPGAPLTVSATIRPLVVLSVDYAHDRTAWEALVPKLGRRRTGGGGTR